jgi:hypothetical protein
LEIPTAIGESCADRGTDTVLRNDIVQGKRNATFNSNGTLSANIMLGAV